MTLTYSDSEAPYSSGDYVYPGEETPDTLLLVGDRILDYISGTLRVSESADRISTARLTVESDEPLFLNEGEPIRLTLRKRLAFTGMLMNPVETWPGHTSRLYQLEGVDFTIIPQQRILSAAYQNTFVGDIVRSIANFLSDEGITAGEIATGPSVVEAVFSYVPCSDALNKLAEMSDYHWRIDELKVLHFGPVTQFPAPYTLTSIDEMTESAGSSKSNKDYRNRQYIRGGKAETEARTESWAGDGRTKTFVTSFPIARDPAITVNGVSQTIAIRGFDDSAKWFWVYGVPGVTQNDNQTAVPDGQAIELSYIGLFDVVVVSSSQGEVERRRELQGFGTGKVEAVDVDGALVTLPDAFQAAAGKLSKYGTAGRELNWSTETMPDLHAGQSIVVDMPEREFDSVTMYVAEIELSDVASRLIKDVRAVEGPDDGDWANWFGRNLKPQQPVSFRENLSEDESLIILTQQTPVWGWDELSTINVNACHVVSDALLIPGSTETYRHASTYSSSLPYYGNSSASELEVC